MIIAFGNLFSTGARSSVLMVLSKFTVPVCLNELSELSGYSVCAVQNAVDGFLREGVLKKDKVRNETVYSIIKSTPHAEIVDAVHQALEKLFLKERSASYRGKPVQILEFVSQTDSFLKKVRKKNENSQRAD